MHMSHNVGTMMSMMVHTLAHRAVYHILQAADVEADIAALTQPPPQRSSPVQKSALVSPSRSSPVHAQPRSPRDSPPPGQRKPRDKDVLARANTAVSLAGIASELVFGDVNTLPEDAASDEYLVEALDMCRGQNERFIVEDLHAHLQQCKVRTGRCLFKRCRSSLLLPLMLCCSHA